MDWLNKDIAKIPRMESFPFRVKMLFFCQNRIYSTGENRGTTPENWLEITIRLSSPGSKFCNDIINGERIHEPYPHAVWKKPGGKKHLDGETPRDAISFGYSSDVLEKFRDLGLYPEHTSRAFFMTDEIRRLIRKFRGLCLRLYSPGVADEIDWVCFQLHREILHAGTMNGEERQTDAERIRNISVWMQQHLHEEINLDEVAGANGYSHAVFFRKWKEVFRVSPLQYILNLKIRSAAKLLRETELPVSQIIREIRYSGQTAFYRRFVREYGLTPDQFRKNRI